MVSTHICTLENDNHTSNRRISLTVAKWALEICHIPWQHASIIVNWLAEVKWKQRVNLTSCCDHFQRSHVQFFLSIISLCLMREMKIWFLWFSNISVCYRKFGLRQGGPSYYGVWKGGLRGMTSTSSQHKYSLKTFEYTWQQIWEIATYLHRRTVMKLCNIPRFKFP